MDITERFLNYTKFDTQSAEDSDTVPSTPKQVIFAEYLKKELESEGFSDVEMDDKAYIYDKYRQVVKVLSLLGAFITPFFWFSSGEIIPILYGKQWLPAIPCLQWMALAMWAQMILSSAGTIFQSLGDTRRLLWSGSMNAIMVVVFIIAGLAEGSIVAVARNVAIAYNLQFVATFYILVHLSFGFRTRDFLKGLKTNGIEFSE